MSERKVPEAKKRKRQKLQQYSKSRSKKAKSQLLKAKSVEETSHESTAAEVATSDTGTSDANVPKSLGVLTSPLIIEHDQEIKEASYPSGRVIVDTEKFIDQIREVEKHTADCQYSGRLVLKSHVSHGLSTRFFYHCNKPLCGANKSVDTSDSKRINFSATWAATSIGIGHWQLEELYAVSGIKFMSDTTYRSYEKKYGKVRFLFVPNERIFIMALFQFLQQVLAENLDLAIMEEIRLAEERMDSTDSDGDKSIKIAIIVDGGWCKRTYGHSFDAKSGVAVIIGERTKKILYVGVHNKYCSICKYVERQGVENKDHVCSKTWSKSSSSMEADLIVGGMKWLQDNYGIECTRIIGDGDSSVISAAQRQLSYGHTIQKAECANHATKNLLRKLEVIRNDSKQFSGKTGKKARDILRNKIPSLTLEARNTITRNEAPNSEAASNEENIRIFKEEIINIPSHIFGDHSKCGEICDQASEQMHVEGKTEKELLTEVGMWAEIENIFLFMGSRVHGLIWNTTNNPAENFMSLVAKTTGGKRVDFSKGNSYAYRSQTAAMNFNCTGVTWHAALYKGKFSKSPVSPLQALIKRRKMHMQRTKTRRELFAASKLAKKTKPRRSEATSTGRDLDYGAPDATPHDLEAMKADFWERQLVTTEEQRREIEISTKLQAVIPLWHTERKKRISATFVKEIVCRKQQTKPAPLVERVLYKSFSKNVPPAVQWGNANEDRAALAYEAKTGTTLSRCGLVIHPDLPYLCASPDRTDEENNKLIEIKCPYSIRYTKSIKESCKSSKVNIGVKMNKVGELVLPKAHKYWYQIQTQLEVTNRESCDLVIWTPNDLEVLTVNRDKESFERMKEKLYSFYWQQILPEIVDSRAARKLPIRNEPQEVNPKADKRQQMKKKQRQTVTNVSVFDKPGTSGC